jgi:hypothetical protein
MRQNTAPFAQLRGQLVEEGAARQAGGKVPKGEQLTDTRHVPALLDSDDASVYAGSDRRSPGSLPGPDRGQ